MTGPADFSIDGEMGEVWRSETVPRLDAAELRRRLERETARLVWIRRIEMGFVPVMLALFALAVPGLPAGQRWGWIAAAGLHTAVVLGFTIWNRRGIWHPLGASTAEYVRLARERGRRKLRSARFVASIIAIEMVALVAWESRGPEAGARLPILVLAMVTVAGTLGGALWYARRVRADLARLASVDRWLDPGSGAEADASP